MISWIVAVLALFVVQCFAAPIIRIVAVDRPLKDRLKFALGPRDEPLPETALSARAGRALKNMFEALPVFAVLALLLLIEGKAAGLGTRGAMVFFLARACYLPAYLSDIDGLRSIVWGIGWVGLGMMLAALF